MNAQKTLAAMLLVCMLAVSGTAFADEYFAGGDSGTNDVWVSGSGVNDVWASSSGGGYASGPAVSGGAYQMYSYYQPAYSYAYMPRSTIYTLYSSNYYGYYPGYAYNYAYYGASPYAYAAYYGGSGYYAYATVVPAVPIGHYSWASKRSMYSY